MEGDRAGDASDPVLYLNIRTKGTQKQHMTLKRIYYLICGVTVPNNEFSILRGTDEKPIEKTQTLLNLHHTLVTLNPDLLKSYKLLMLHTHKWAVEFKTPPHV